MPSSRRRNFSLLPAFGTCGHVKVYQATCSASPGLKTELQTFCFPAAHMSTTWMLQGLRDFYPPSFLPVQCWDGISS